MLNSTRRKVAKVAIKKSYIIRRPTLADLQLGAEEKKAINEYFAWEKRSAETELIVGKPMGAY